MKRRPKSLRKHLRQQKARIRREVLDTNEQNKQIEKLYEQINQKTTKTAKSQERATRPC